MNNKILDGFTKPLGVRSYYKDIDVKHGVYGMGGIIQNNG